MTHILNIETATKNCSVSIANNGKITAIEEINDGGYSHSEQLHLLIAKVLNEAKISFDDLNAVAVSKGPGSYTGLRIGVSAAKGLCFALDIPLISISTLQSLSNSISIDSGYIIPLLDARRMEVYSSVFDENHETIRSVRAEIINSNSFEKYLANKNCYFLGDGAEKCRALITHKNAHFILNKFPSSNEMGNLSYLKYKKNDIEDVAYFEPFYLKDFMVTKSKK